MMQRLHGRLLSLRDSMALLNESDVLRIGVDQVEVSPFVERAIHRYRGDLDALPEHSDLAHQGVEARDRDYRDKKAQEEG